MRLNGILDTENTETQKTAKAEDWMSVPCESGA